MTSARTFYQDTGQMEALDEDLVNALRDWVDRRHALLTPFEIGILIQVTRCILATGFAHMKAKDKALERDY